MLGLTNNEINYYQLYNINKWTSEEISKFEKMKEIINPKDFNDCLNTIYEYKLPFNKINSLNKENLHKIGIKSFYKDAYNRNIDELLKEHELILKEKGIIQKNKNLDCSISQRVKKIKQLSNNFKNNSNIITKKTINETKNIYLKEDNDALIAIINNAIKSQFGYELRDSQIYSLLILLDKDKERGKIVQILTGEGKTLIINCLAIIMVLKGHKVDIVTSNPILAKRDSKESKKLYDYFGISVGDNIDKEEMINLWLEEKNEVYKKDIIYGTTLEYQGDILDDEYNLSGIRNNRGFDIVIVDEIDSMLIDEYASKTRLATHKPFLEKYSIFLQILWGYYINLHLSDEEVIKDEELCQKLQEYLKKRIINVINTKDEKSKFYFPMSSMTKEFALDQVDNWVVSLISCLKKEKDKEYIIKDNNIVPVDQENTGVIQNLVSWSHGLHQFLQMKHNLPVTPINIITNYLSNLGFFKRYIKSKGNFIFGMTGTLGSKKARELLANVYSLDFDFIPPNSQRILTELTSCICFDNSNFIKNIKRIVKRETDGGRAILIICESIGAVNNIFDEIKMYCPNLNLIKIIGEDNEDKKIPKLLQSKTVIISTNISGRGTDLKLGEDILKKGGLHVIITFIPNNSRVEEQNYGRAGRKGEPGTWQLVINFQEIINNYFIINDLENRFIKYREIVQNMNLIENNNIDEQFMNIFKIDYLRQIREEREIRRLDDSYKYIVKVDKEDYLFNLFCDMLYEKKELRNKENKIYLDSIEEKWAIFLYNLNLMNKTWKQVEDEFIQFKNKITEELNNNTVIENPGFYNKFVNEKLSLLCDNEKEKSIIGEIGDTFKDTINRAKKIFKKNQNEIFEYEKYIHFCDLSIQKDPNSFIPFFLKAICKILQGKEGLKELNISSNLLNREIEGYQNLYGLFKTLKINSDFAYHQINILNNIKIHIIDQNINDYYNKNANNLKIKKKKFDDIFSFNNQSKDKGNKDRKIPHYLDKYFTSMKDNGLEYFYFIKEKASLFKAALMIGAGIGLIALSIYTGGIIGGFVGAIGASIGAVLGTSIITNQIDDIIKGVHDRSFPGSYDVGFFDFLKKRKKIRKYAELNIDEICGKYDSEYEQKKIKEDEKNFKNEFIKKFRKFGLTNKEINLVNEIEEQSEIKKDEENIKNTKRKLEQKKKEFKKNLNAEEKKSILGNMLSRAAGRDLIENYKDDIHEDIKKNQKSLENNFEVMLIDKVKNYYNDEINKKREEFNSNEEKIEKIRQKYKLRSEKLKEEFKKIQYKYDIYNKKNQNLSLIKDNFNKKSELFNNEVAKLDDDIEIMNEKISRKNNGDNTIIIYDFEKENLQNRINASSKKREEINKEREELNKQISSMEEERINLNKENNEYNKKSDKLDWERNNLNNLIDESNKNQQKLNEHVRFYNKLDKIDLIMDFKGDNLKLDIKEPSNKLNDLIKLDSILEKVQDHANTAFEKELEHLAKNEIEKENNKKVILIKEKFERNLERVINERHSNWDNLYNKSFFDDKYLYNYDDMKKVAKYYLKKIIKDDFFYISDLENHKSIEKMKIFVKNKKNIYGNCFNDENKTWDTFCLVLNEGNYIFLYKSSIGNYPSEKLKNLIKCTLNKNYYSKINIIKDNDENKFTEVDSIENIKIIAQKLVNNDTIFFENFETYKNFYKESNNKKLDKKKEIYPKVYIKSVYNSLKKINNSSRISLGLFKKYYLDFEKEGGIEIEFLKNIYQILINSDEIDNKEKNIIKKEYNDIISVYYKNKFNYGDNDNDNVDNLDEINKNTKLDDVEKLKTIDINTNKNSNKIKEDQVNKEFNTANTTDESDKTNNNNNNENITKEINLNEPENKNDSKKSEKKNTKEKNDIENIYSRLDNENKLNNDKIEKEVKTNNKHKKNLNLQKLEFDDKSSLNKSISGYTVLDSKSGKKINQIKENKNEKIINKNNIRINKSYNKTINKRRKKNKNSFSQLDKEKNEVGVIDEINSNKKKNNLNYKNMPNIKIERDISYKNIKTEENKVNKIKKRKIYNKSQDKTIKQSMKNKINLKSDKNFEISNKNLIKRDKSHEILINKNKKDILNEREIKKPNENNMNSLITSRTIRIKENQKTMLKNSNKEEFIDTNLSLTTIKNIGRNPFNNKDQINLKESTNNTLNSAQNKIINIKKNIRTKEKVNNRIYISKTNFSKTPDKASIIFKKERDNYLFNNNDINIPKNTMKFKINKKPENINVFNNIHNNRQNNHIIQEERNDTIDTSSRNHDNKNNFNKRSKTPLIETRNIIKRKKKNKILNDNNKDEEKKYEIIINKDLQIIKDIIINYFGKDCTKIITINKEIIFETKMLYENKKIEIKLYLNKIEKIKFNLIAVLIGGDLKHFETLFLLLKDKIK